MKHLPLIAGAVTALLLGSGNASAQEFPLTITDALGNEFTFEEPPAIGCYHWSCHETMGDLGLVPAAVAWANAVNDGRPFWIAFNAGTPDVFIQDAFSPEEWAAAGVDVIVTAAFTVDEIAGLAANSPAPIFYLEMSGYGDSARGTEAYVNNLRLLGQLTGEMDAAESAIARWRNVETNLAYLAEEGDADQTILGILNWDSAFSAMGNDNPFCVLIDDLEIGECMDVDGLLEVTVNDEEVLAQDPDWIIIQDAANIAGQGAAPDYTILDRTDNPFWNQLTAVQDGNVYYGGERYYCCSTRGMTHAMNEYAHYILDRRIPHPGNFADFNYEYNALVLDPEVFQAKFPL